MNDAAPPLRWLAIFSDQPAAIVELYEPGDHLARFDIAGQLGHIANRKIKGMWIVRREGWRDDVMRVHSSVPAEISGRFYADRHRNSRSNDHRVRIFLRPADRSPGRYIGERDLREPPGVDGRIAFEHDGRMKTGKVERIAPADWRPDSALIPSVHVVEDALKR